MTADHQAHRGSGWEAMQRTLAADAVVAEALLYASGGRRLTVEHGQPLTGQAGALVQQLVDDVDQAATNAGHLGGGTVTSRGTSITWTFPATDVPAAHRGEAAQILMLVAQIGRLSQSVAALGEAQGRSAQAAAARRAAAQVGDAAEHWSAESSALVADK